MSKKTMLVIMDGWGLGKVKSVRCHPACQCAFCNIPYTEISEYYLNYLRRSRWIYRKDRWEIPKLAT